MSRSKSFTIKVPKVRARNPLGEFQERKQVMKNRRDKRSKDARKSWKNEEW